MGWDEAHRYYAALREIEDELDRTGDGMPPWRAGYAEVFGDRRGLLLALWRRWEVTVQAQAGDRPLRELAAEHPGLLRALRRNAAGLGGLSFTDPAPETTTVHLGGAA